MSNGFLGLTVVNSEKRREEYFMEVCFLKKSVGRKRRLAQECSLLTEEHQ